MNALWVTLMVVGLIGMIVCSKKQKTNPAMQPVAIALFLVVVVAAGGLLHNLGIFGGSSSSLMESELAFLASRGNAAGTHLKQVAPGKKVLIIAEPNFDKNPQNKALVDLFKEAYGSQDVVVAAPNIPAASDDNPVPFEEIMKAKDFDALLAQNKDAGVIVSLIGLPQDARRMAAFRNLKTAPKFFLLSTGMGNGKYVTHLVQNDVVVGVIVPNTKANYDIKAPSDPAEAFKIRFVIATKSNLDANKQYFE